MHILLNEDEIAYIEGENGTIALAKTKGHFFYLETEQKEIVLFTEPDELMIASSFGRGEKIRRGLHCTLFQLRELRAPLIVLPKGHPASPRLKTVVSIGPLTRLSCKIEPGTHPEQNVLCGSEEFHGLEIIAEPEGAEVRGLLADGGMVVVERF
ncbi:hypothetical protein [Methanothrix sp.]|uniref:hypothetical protein n=1 Tax=Methanothrix sp. TaxID=90426 RepID=UPI0032991DB7